MTEYLKFLVFTDCGSDIGFGHLNRCTSIKSALVKKSVEVVFEVFDDRNDADVMLDWLDNWVQVVGFHRPTHVLVDSFRADDAFFEQLTALKINVVVIDDFPERNHKKGTVINWTVGAEVESFLPRNPNVTYLLGPEYCCLRSEFSKSTEINSFEENAVLVTFGGSDVRRLSVPIVEHISSNYKDLRVYLVLGQGAEPHDFSRLSNVNVFKNCSAGKMCALMDNAEFALCGGGQTLYEMAARGLPPIIIPLVDNQLADIEGFVGRGFGLKVAGWQDAGLFNTVDAAILNIQEKGNRQAQAKKGVGLVDGGGLSRLVEKLLQ